MSGYRPAFADPEAYHLVGPFIASVRRGLDITQAQVSEATGFSIQSISRFENGKVSPTTVMAAYVIGYVLDQVEPKPTVADVIATFDDFVAENKTFSAPIMDS